MVVVVGLVIVVGGAVVVELVGRFSSIETVPDSSLATAKSGVPSPLKSAAIHSYRLIADIVICCWLEGTISISY